MKPMEKKGGICYNRNSIYGQVRAVKKTLAVFLCVVLLAGLFSGCRKSAVSALYLAVNGTAGSFDPQIAAGDAVRIVVRNSFEGLVALDEAGVPVPAAAERWTVSPDGLVYTFYLRKGALWHVSDTVKKGLEEKLPEDFAPEVTAADFVFALRRAVDPVTGAPDAALLSNIKGAADILAGAAAPAALGVAAEGKYRLTVMLERPEPGFLEALAEPVAMPCNQAFFEATGGRYGLLMKYIISNGPFYLTRFEDTAFRMARNPDYTGARVAKTDVIWLYSGEAQSVVLDNLGSKDYDGACLPEHVALANAPKGAEVLNAADTLRGFLFNCKNEALAEANIRRAFFASAEPQVLAEAFGKEPAAAVCPASLKPQTAFAVRYNEARAESLMRAGLESLGMQNVSLSLLCEETYDTAMRRYLQTWQRVFGVLCSVEIEAVSADTLKTRVEKGDYDLAFYPVRADRYAPAAYFARFADALCGWNNDAYAAAVENLRFAEGDAAALQKNAETLLSGANVFLPVWQEGTSFVAVSGVSGVSLLSGPDRLYLCNAQKD